MDLKQLEYFVRVAELGSFTRAAQALDVAQPALSRQVRLLEVELRQNLLIRNGRGANPTEAGLLLLAHARGILHQVERAREELGRVRGALAGRVAIGLPPSLSRVLAVPLMRAFRQQLPQVSAAISEGLSVNMQEWLTTGRLDIAVLYNAQPAPGLEIGPLLEEELVLVQARPAGLPPHLADEVAPSPIALREIAEETIDLNQIEQDLVKSLSRAPEPEPADEEVLDLIPTDQNIFGLQESAAEEEAATLNVEVDDLSTEDMAAAIEAEHRSVTYEEWRPGILHEGHRQRVQPAAAQQQHRARLSVGIAHQHLDRHIRHQQPRQVGRESLVAQVVTQPDRSHRIEISRQPGASQHHAIRRGQRRQRQPLPHQQPRAAAPPASRRYGPLWRPGPRRGPAGTWWPTWAPTGPASTPPGVKAAARGRPIARRASCRAAASRWR